MSVCVCVDVWLWWVRTVGSYCFRLLIDGNYWEVCEFERAPPAAFYRPGLVTDGCGLQKRALAASRPRSGHPEQGTGGKAKNTFSSCWTHRISKRKPRR